MKPYSYKIIILTLNAASSWNSWYSSLKVLPDIQKNMLLIDSESDDDTVKLARQASIEVVSIKRADFNHGATREMARKYVNADIVIFMTQDAIPSDSLLIERLIEPIIKGDASFSYARQLPRAGADLFESFPRKFNYPPASNLRGIEDTEKYGVYTFFCSDSCAAYLNSALDEIGGFRPTLTNEDYFASARLLNKGHKVAYVAEATVIHSHAYSLVNEFKRYFDTGYVRAENPWVQEIVGQAEGRGKDYFLALVSELVNKSPWLVPYAVLNTFIKFLGYRTGFWLLHAPKWCKKIFSSQAYYWDSKYYEPGKGMNR